jgi:hypothetical protein
MIAAAVNTFVDDALRNVVSSVTATRGCAISCTPPGEVEKDGFGFGNDVLKAWDLYPKKTVQQIAGTAAWSVERGSLHGGGGILGTDKVRMLVGSRSTGMKSGATTELKKCSGRLCEWERFCGDRCLFLPHSPRVPSGNNPKKDIHHFVHILVSIQRW